MFEKVRQKIRFTNALKIKRIKTAETNNIEVCSDKGVKGIKVKTNFNLSPE